MRMHCTMGLARRYPLLMLFEFVKILL
jgi:hypothetical protein